MHVHRESRVGRDLHEIARPSGPGSIDGAPRGSPVGTAQHEKRAAQGNARRELGSRKAGGRVTRPRGIGRNSRGNSTDKNGALRSGAVVAADDIERIGRGYRRVAVTRGRQRGIGIIRPGELPVRLQFEHPDIAPGRHAVAAPGHVKAASDQGHAVRITRFRQMICGGIPGPETPDSVELGGLYGPGRQPGCIAAGDLQPVSGHRGRVEVYGHVQVPFRLPGRQHACGGDVRRPDLGAYRALAVAAHDVKPAARRHQLVPVQALRHETRRLPGARPGVRDLSPVHRAGSVDAGVAAGDEDVGAVDDRGQAVAGGRQGQRLGPGLPLHGRRVGESRKGHVQGVMSRVFEAESTGRDRRRLRNSDV